MGSFNTSCMVTQQTITPGMECIILPISQQATYNPVKLVKNAQEFSPYGFAHTTCYPTAFWGYAGPLIQGEYDDYGRFSLFDTPENNTNLKEFFNDILHKSCETLAGENSCHDHPFKMSDIYQNKEHSFEELVGVWDKVWEVSCENRLFIVDYNGQPRNLQFAVMHQASADYLIDLVSHMKDYSGQSYEQKEYFSQYMKKFESQLGAKESHLVYSLGSLSNYRLGEQEGCYLSNHYDNTQEVLDLCENTSDFAQLIDDLFDIFKPQLDHRYIHTGLNMLNIKLSPMVYASQDRDNSIGKAYAKMVKTVSAKINREIKENH